MNEIFKVILSLSLSGSVLILVLLLCKPLLKHKISKRWQYYIWLVVIIRLLLPFTPDVSPVGTLFQAVDKAIVQRDTTNSPEQNTASMPQTENDQSIKGDAAPQEEEPSTAARPAVQRTFKMFIENLWLVWLVTALALLIRKITIYQGFVKYIRAGRTEVSDTALLDRLAQIGERAGVKRSVELYTNSLISSPLLLGFFRPCIVLATVDLSDSDFEYTILHELTHYKRRDMFYKWLIQIAVCLHWFNPLVYVMGREVNRECELACDEAVIKTLGKEEQRAYGDTLLNAIRAGGSYKDSLASVTLNESKELLKERLEAIMKYKRKSKMVAVFTLVVTVFLVAGASTLGAHAAQQLSFDSQNSLENVHSSGNIESSALTQKSGGFLSNNEEELHISLEINNGGVEVFPAAANEIQASYDHQYYDVQFTEQNGKRIVSISGKAAKMGDTNFVQLFLPKVKRNLDVQVKDGDFCYDLSPDGTDEIQVTAADGGVHFTSANRYDNSSISVTAQNKDFIVYEEPVYPDYFSKTDAGFTYRNGTEANQIDVLLTGYTRVEFTETQPTASSVVSALKDLEADPVKSVSITAESSGIELIKSQNGKFTFDYLGVVDTTKFKVNASVSDGVLQVTADGTAARAAARNYYVNSGPNYANVVRIGIPDKEYQNIALTLDGAPASLPDFRAAISIKAADSTISISDTDISKGKYQISNLSGSVAIRAATFSSNISVENNGECTLFFQEVPQNLGLDVSGCSGQVVLPAGWSDIHTLGNGMPMVKIRNHGYTEVSVNDKT